MIQTGADAGWIGIGLRLAHLVEMQGRPEVPVDFVEVHAENYFDAASAQRSILVEIAQRVPVSIHGVALSLGSAEGIDDEHLARLVDLVADTRPCLVSEHLAWSRVDGVYYNDLLALPRDQETLDVVARNVDRAQAALHRPILVENPSGYLDFEESTISEGEFLARLCAMTGCGVLLDVNNLYISAANLGSDTAAWFDSVPSAAIAEIHLAGHEPDVSGSGLLVDTHNRPVAGGVWSLFAEAVDRYGPRPTVIEWDDDLPELDLLFDQALQIRCEPARARTLVS